MYHPDRNPGDSTANAKMAEINEAYDRLSQRNRGSRRYVSRTPEETDDNSFKESHQSTKANSQRHPKRTPHGNKDEYKGDAHSNSKAEKEGSNRGHKTKGSTNEEWRTGRKVNPGTDGKGKDKFKDSKSSGRVEL